MQWASVDIASTVRGGEPWAEFWARTMRQWQDEMVPYGTPREMIEGAVRRLETPETLEAALGLVYAVGQRSFQEPPTSPDSGGPPARDAA